MSYAQTPLPSTSTAEVAQDTPFPFVAHQPVGGSINAPGFQPQGIKKRKQSKSKPSPELRRSVSTPHIRGLAMGDAGASSPISDKKRNKLGYHRTSVACVHCRRRKIRCLLAPDDPQGRCTNCIRLKKECHFYPVEHQGGPEQRPPTAAVGDASSGAPSVSTPSSPRTSSTNFAERQQDQHQYSRMPNHPPLPPKQNVPFTVGMDGHASQYQSNGGEYSHLSTMATTGSLMAKTSMPHAALAYAPQNNWGPPSFLLQSNGSNETQQPHTTAEPWQSMPQPTAPIYAESRPPGIPEQRNTPTVPQSPYAFSSSEPGWTAPTRSMSYGNIEGLPHQVPYGHFQPPQDYRPKPGAVGYPTPLNTNPGPSPMGSIHEHPPMSAPIVGSGQYGYPPGWNSYQVQTPGSDSVASSHPIHSPWLQEQAYSKHEEESGSGAHYAQHQQYYARH